MGGIRRRLIFLIFAGLFVIMGFIGTSRYVIEKRDILAAVQTQGEQSGKLMAEIAAPLLIGQIVALELPLEQNFLVIGAFGVIGAVALALISHGGLASQPIPQNA